VVYFGGSITDVAGWRVGFDEWLRRTYPASRITMTNASIGGTGSDLGVFRVAADVLPHAPDLVFVEFSVNDSNKDLVRAGRCVEGIVRQLRRARPECDICFVYTLCNAPSVIEPFRRSELPPAAAVHDRVAEHYGLPAVVLGAEVLRLEAAGKLTLVARGDERAGLERQDITVFCEDGAHPLPAGHDLYVQTLAAAWPQLLAESATPTTFAAPLDAANWEDARLVPLSCLDRDAGVEPLADDAWPRLAWGREHMPELWRVDQEGAGLEFAFIGTAFGIYDVLGPDSGQVRVTIDDWPATSVPRFDAACSYHRPNYAILADGLPRARHRVRIELGPPLADKGGVVPEARTEPERFAGSRWYPAALLIVGKHEEHRFHQELDR
jgi:lysophospholipase L1-like esterase